jgi:hypothetical protein
LKKLPAPLVRDSDKIALADHAWFFCPDPVGNETAVVAGFIIIGALMTEQVVRRKLDRQVKEILGHCKFNGIGARMFRPKPKLSRSGIRFRPTIAQQGRAGDDALRRFGGRKQLITLPLIRPLPAPCIFSLDRF